MNRLVPSSLVDICFVTMISPSQLGDERVAAQAQRLRELLDGSSFTYIHRTFSCDGSACEDKFEDLTSKTYAMLVESLRCVRSCFRTHSSRLFSHRVFEDSCRTHPA